MSADIEITAGALPAAGDDSIHRLVAAWLLGYESPATRRNYGADLSAWLAFSDSYRFDPLQARRAHVVRAC